MNIPKHEYDETAETRKSGVHNRLLPDLKALLDGELAAPRVWFVRAHLWFCPACREEVKWLKRLGEDMRDLERAVPSPRLRARILAALPDTPPGRPALLPARTARMTRFVLAGAIACLCIAVFAAGKYGAAFHAARPYSPTLATTPGGSSDTTRPQHAALVTPPQAAIPTAPDPHTIAADRMLAQWEQREDRQLHNNRLNWSKLAASIHALSAGHHLDQPLRLALAVPDLNDAEDHLTAWATSIGGAVSSPRPQPSPNSVAPMVTTAEPAYRPYAVAPAAPEPIITVRVPLARVASLEPVLRQIGAWESTRKMYGSMSEQPGEVEHPTSGAKPEPRSNHPAETAMDPKGQTTNIAAARLGAPDQVVSRDTAPAWVTLRIHLTNLEGFLP